MVRAAQSLVGKMILVGLLLTSRQRLVALALMLAGGASCHPGCGAGRYGLLSNRKHNITQQATRRCFGCITISIAAKLQANDWRLLIVSSLLARLCAPQDTKLVRGVLQFAYVRKQ